MSIPVYYAVREEETTKEPAGHLAQIGFGMSSDGVLRLPERVMNGPIIIDDAVISGWSGETISALSAYCSNGYFLDFERSPCETHREIIEGLPKGTLLGLPWLFYPWAGHGLPILSCPRPCNSWKQFLKNCQQQFPGGWLLEVTPWHHVRPASQGTETGFLPYALCHYQRKNGHILYYDTEKTIKEKLSLAEQFSCRAGVALLEEIRSL